MAEFSLKSGHLHKNILLDSSLNYSGYASKDKQVNSSIVIQSDNWNEDEVFEFNRLNKQIPYIARDKIVSDLTFKAILFSMPQLVKVPGFNIDFMMGDTETEAVYFPNYFSCLIVEIVAKDIGIFVTKSPVLGLKFSEVNVKNIDIKDNIDVHGIVFDIKYGVAKSVTNYFHNAISVNSVNIDIQFANEPASFRLFTLSLDTVGLDADIDFSSNVDVRRTVIEIDTDSLEIDLDFNIEVTSFRPVNLIDASGLDIGFDFNDRLEMVVSTNDAIANGILIDFYIHTAELDLFLPVKEVSSSGFDVEVEVNLNRIGLLVSNVDTVAFSIDVIFHSSELEFFLPVKEISSSGIDISVTFASIRLSTDYTVALSPTFGILYGTAAYATPPTFASISTYIVEYVVESL